MIPAITPATLDLKTPSGSSFEMQLEMVTPAGMTVPLSSIGPFKAACRRRRRSDPVLFEFEVDNTHLAANWIQLSADVPEGLDGIARWDLIDAMGRVWVMGQADLTPSITERA